MQQQGSLKGHEEVRINLAIPFRLKSLQLCPDHLMKHPLKGRAAACPAFLRPRERRRQVLRKDQRRRGEHASALDRILQLPHVSGPIVCEHLLQRLGRHRPWLPPLLLGKQSEEVAHEKWDVLPSPPERGEVDTHHIQSVVEILSKALLRNRSLEVLVCGGDDPDIAREWPLAAHAFELPLLEDTQDFSLKPKVHVPDLIEEKRPALCH